MGEYEVCGGSGVCREGGGLEGCWGGGMGTCVVLGGCGGEWMHVYGVVCLWDPLYKTCPAIIARCLGCQQQQQAVESQGAHSPRQVEPRSSAWSWQAPGLHVVGPLVPLHGAPVPEACAARGSPTR